MERTRHRNSVPDFLVRGTPLCPFSPPLDAARGSRHILGALLLELEMKLAADRRVIEQQAMSSTAELFASAVFLTRMKLRHLTAQKNDWEKRIRQHAGIGE